MTLARLVQIKSSVEELGWRIELSNRDLYKVFDNQIVWPIRYKDGEKNLKIIFQLVEDFGGRTEKLADLLFFRIDDHDQEFVFGKIATDRWKEELIKFRHELLLISTNS